MKKEKYVRNQEKKACSMLVETIFGTRPDNIATLEDYEPKYDAEMQEQLQAEVKLVMNKILKKQEQSVISMRFGFAGDIKTYEQIAGKWNMSRENVREIEAKALRKLKHPRHCCQLMNIIDNSKRI